MNYSRYKRLILCGGLAALLVLAGCSGSDKAKNRDDKAVSGVASEVQGDTAWKYDKAIKKPLKAVAGNAEAVLGDLEQNRVVVKIPGKAFDSDTKVTLENPNEVPKVIGEQFKPIDAPIDIKTGNKPVRLNEPVTITMKVDKNRLEKDIDRGSVLVAYYDGAAWEYIKPDSFDLNAGTITFTTFHFCLFGYGKVSVEEQIKKYTHSKTLSEVVQGQVDDKVDKAAEQVIDHILKDKLGIKDETTKLKVLSSLLKDDDYKDIYDRFKDGDVAGFNQSLQVFAGKKIAENVSESTLQKGLSALASKSGVEYAQAASKAAGYIAEGRIKDAAKILGEKIADEFVITKIGKVAVEAINYEIDVWKNSEVEAAYKAYKDGATGYFWGYNNDAKDFNAVYDQMRGIRRQLEIEAIRKQNEAREEAGQPPLSEKEMENIRTKIKADMKRQFELRVKNEDEIAKKEAELKSLIDAYKEANLLESSRFGFNTAYDTLDTRLDKLLHLRDKILRDTGRSQLSDSPFTNDKALSVNDLVILSQLWYSNNGRAQYAKYLKDKLGIELYPKPAELGGNWGKGTFVITEFYDPAANSAGGKGSSEGCDFTAELEKMKNKPMPTTIDMNISPNGTGKMTMSVAGADGKPNEMQPMGMKYADGVVNASLKQKEGTMSMTGETRRTADGYAMEGTWVFKAPNGAYMKGKWSSAKSK